MVLSLVFVGVGKGAWCYIRAYMQLFAGHLRFRSGDDGESVLGLFCFRFAISPSSFPSPQYLSVSSMKRMGSEKKWWRN